MILTDESSNVQLSDFSELEVRLAKRCRPPYCEKYSNEDSQHSVVRNAFRTLKTHQTSYYNNVGSSSSNSARA